MYPSFIPFHGGLAFLNRTNMKAPSSVSQKTAVSSVYFMGSHMMLEIIVTWPNLLTFPLRLCPPHLDLDLTVFQKLTSCHSTNTGLSWLTFIINRYFYEPQCRGIHFQRLFWHFGTACVTAYGWELLELSYIWAIEWTIWGIFNWCEYGMQ